MKNKKFLFAVCFAIVSCLILGLLHLQTDKSNTVRFNRLFVNNENFKLEVANTDVERVEGLSGRNALRKDTAMLFVFPEAAEQCMWMKDMKFSIDMVWLDEGKKITKIEEAVSPDTYPQAYCSDATKYVLEFNAGVTKKSNLKIGQNLNF